MGEKTDKSLAEQFEQLRRAYKAHWLVKDTEAFQKFCFANSDALSALLVKGAGQR